jgi:hypothetical protein
MNLLSDAREYQD